MSSESKTVVIVSLNGSNYGIRMAFLRDGLWDLVNGIETAPREDASKWANYLARKDRALATIVLSIEPSLLYLIGEPEDPIVVWKKLLDQFQKKTWANKLALRRKLYSLKLKDGDAVQEHIKVMIKTFDALSVVGDRIEEEDRVVHLLASLPDSFNMLVTAFEACEDVPKMEVVTERLLHEERKLREQDAEKPSSDAKALTGKQISNGKGPKCHYYGRFGHIKRNCRDFNDFVQSKDVNRETKKVSYKHKANKAGVKKLSSSSDSESVGLIVSHALAISSEKGLNSWIVDSGATCHMCNDKEMFVEFNNLEPSQEVTLGDGYSVEATGCGTVRLKMQLTDDKTKECKMSDVLYVPQLSYNLLSVSKATQSGKKVKFTENDCYITDMNQKLIATANKEGSLYYVNYGESEHVCAEKANVHKDSKEQVWHRRYGHLGMQNLKKMCSESLVDGFDFDVSKDIDFCESCVAGKASSQYVQN